VLRVAERTERGRVGPDRVWIDALFAATRGFQRMEFGEPTLAAFKARLLAAHRAGLVVLSAAPAELSKKRRTAAQLRAGDEVLHLLRPY
jgi:hypothetical protein